MTECIGVKRQYRTCRCFRLSATQADPGKLPRTDLLGTDKSLLRLTRFSSNVPANVLLARNPDRSKCPGGSAWVGRSRHIGRFIS